MGQPALQVLEALPGLAQGLHDPGRRGNAVGQVNPMISRIRPREGLQGALEIGQFPDQKEESCRQRSPAAGADFIPRQRRLSEKR